MRVKVDRTGLYTYPGAMILCGMPQFDGDGKDVLLNPQVVFEVLSPSTERYDRTTKFRHYGQTETLQEYVLVAQDQPRVERYIRQPDGQWLLAVFDILDATFALTSVPVEVPLADIYRGVEFPPDAGKPNGDEPNR